MSSATRRVSYCRLCASSCGVLLDIQDGRITRVLGDSEHPISQGYTCPKGRRAGDLAHGPQRLRTSLRREAGTFAPVEAATATAEIAHRLRAIADRHGPDAVALFTGTQHNFAALTPPMARAWFRGTGSHKLFSTMTIDQSAKWVVADRMGRYLGGRQRFEDADVWLLAGTNPLVSANGGDGDGAVVHNPAAALRAAEARGLRLIVVDPRRTETAAMADLHLAPRPGTDAVLFAGLLRVILTERLHDAAFCARFAAELPLLTAAVAPATPALVEKRCGVVPDELRAAARLFARGPRGMATTGTGVCMGPHSNLAEHLVTALNVVCGRFRRAGEPADRRSVLTRWQDVRAEVAGPAPADGFRSRIGGIRAIRGELPSGILADEILEPGPDRVRALIVSGGNPAAALPDRAGARRALGALELLVCVDPVLSATARLAHYVIAPATMYERADHTAIMEPFFPRPFAQYTPAILEPPPGVLEDWRFFFDLAVAAGQPVKFAGRILDPAAPPSAEELLAMTTERGRVPFADLVAAPHGYPVPADTATVAPGTGDERLRLLPADVAAELRAALAAPAVAPGYPFLLTVRRIREAINSTGIGVEGLVPDGAGAAALHPDDLAALGLADGARAQLRSPTGQVRVTVRADRSVARGTVTMTHAFDGPGSRGGAVNALTSTTAGTQAINAMPTLTAVPVAVTRMREEHPR
ncbi:molybdopterin-dependent oxidoreductase [Nocardia sp. NPDC057227]|uniref:molybdopterin-containing oxidoreductase family protein n=1 Tax=Nocardia sp. NPDC057227 TaxID=3346056 RepID=UPI00363C5654